MLKEIEMADSGTATENDETTYIDVPEAVGIFDTFEAQQAAFYDLRSVGFHHSDISLLGSEETLRKSLARDTGAPTSWRTIQGRLGRTSCRKRPWESLRGRSRADSFSSAPRLP